MNGKLIVIEGLDGGGKSTQLELLKPDFPEFEFITFPNYASPSGEIIKSYLSGDYAEEDPLTSAYSASAFYAVDRYVSFKTSWEKPYRSGKTVISSRYVSSNAIYQTAKLPENLWENYIDWLNDFEYNKLSLPKPNATIFLNMPLHISRKLLLRRCGGDEKKLDLHESNTDFMNLCMRSALYMAKAENWRVIDCFEGDEPLPATVIHEILKKHIKELI